MKYYFDTSIWLDYFENRKDRFRPLGEWALALLAKIKAEKGKILVSDIVMDELKDQNAPVKEILGPFMEQIAAVEMNKEQYAEGKKISAQRHVPKGDALHAIISRDCKCILISRDNHFTLLTDINKAYKPEELI